MMSTIITILFAVIFQGATLWFCRGLKFSVRRLCYASLACALTIVLSYIYIPLPTGSSIACCTVLPLMVLAAVTDYRLAMFSGWVCGVLVMFLVPGWQPVHWGQIFVEQMVCFSCLGYTAIFGTQNRGRLLCGALLASVLKIVGHILSGVLFFSQNAWAGWGAWGYSLAYNLSSTVPECAISIVLLLLLPLGALRRAASKGGAL